MGIRSGRVALAVFVTVVTALSPSRLAAQGAFLWQGLINLEGYKTDSASLLLARGSGHPSLLGRVDSWAAFEPVSNVDLFGELMEEGGPARDEAGNELYLKQYGLRYSPSDAFTLQAGKVAQVVGVFSARQLSTRNPLIGVPDGYATTYPRGARVDGSVSVFDYRAGLLSLPLWRDGYTPDPSAAWRPSVGLGITPTTGLRLGMSGTYGPYLNNSFTAAELHNLDWTSYKEGIVAADAEFSRGYYEFHFEGAHSTYDVPGQSGTQNGLEFYVESKYTFTPRFFLAGRFERNDYPFIGLFGNFWVANNSIVDDGEIGGGFRPSASTLMKLSLRKDHWWPNSNPGAPHDDGYAVMFQLTQSFDVMELLSRRQ